MKFIATIEARMTSSRRPGKVMLKAVGEPMLAHIVNMLKSIRSIDGIVLATTTNSNDDVPCSLAKDLGIGCYRGSENDVMTRVIEGCIAFVDSHPFNDRIRKSCSIRGATASIKLHSERGDDRLEPQCRQID